MLPPLTEGSTFSASCSNSRQNSRQGTRPNSRQSLVGSPPGSRGNFNLSGPAGIDLDSLLAVNNYEDDDLELEPKIVEESEKEVLPTKEKLIAQAEELVVRGNYLQAVSVFQKVIDAEVEQCESAVKLQAFGRVSQSAVGSFAGTGDDTTGTTGAGAGGAERVSPPLQKQKQRQWEMMEYTAASQMITQLMLRQANCLMLAADFARSADLLNRVLRVREGLLYESVVSGRDAEIDGSADGASAETTSSSTKLFSPAVSGARTRDGK